tara:strand:+ start:1292 stop:1519 length:228 start_codon:yes stop_codon:yes gene_type:complete
MIDELDNILNTIDLEEEKLDVEENEEWYCEDCEHGPMAEKENKCSRCGAKHGKHYEEEMTGWEDEDIESEVEEIW